MKLVMAKVSLRKKTGVFLPVSGRVNMHEEDWGVFDERPDLIEEENWDV